MYTINHRFQEAGETFFEGHTVGRPKKPETMETLSVRLPAAMVSEIDRFVEELQAQLPLLLISRADGVRQLLALALEAQKKEKRRRG